MDVIIEMPETATLGFSFKGRYCVLGGRERSSVESGCENRILKLDLPVLRRHSMMPSPGISTARIVNVRCAAREAMSSRPASWRSPVVEPIALVHTLLRALRVFYLD